MIGLPLRLLAREVYDRVRLRVGDHQVALVTGEEKIIPAQPRFWVCTVEAMPADIDVAFLAIDEIQLAADFERGHIFTDRLLHRRGREETMLLGAATMRPIVEKLLPGVSHVSRPRFSKLTYAGQKKITRLPRRIRHRRLLRRHGLCGRRTDPPPARRCGGGAWRACRRAPAMPKSRSINRAMSTTSWRPMRSAWASTWMSTMSPSPPSANSTASNIAISIPANSAQVAGRAGRYMNDGTFGVTGEAEPFEPEVIDRIENHNFEPVRMLQWRNRDFDFASLDDLAPLAQCDAAQRRADARTAGARRAGARSDGARRRVVELASSTRSGRATVGSLPDSRLSQYQRRRACQSGRPHLPFPADRETATFRKTGSRVSSPIATAPKATSTRLSNRISHVRTWTFVANRADWLEAPVFWQQRAREIEDKLSDALHERLTARFIDRRTSVLMKRLAQKEQLMSTVEEDGAIHVEGEYVGRIQGFQFVPDGAAE